MQTRKREKKLGWKCALSLQGIPAWIVTCYFFLLIRNCSVRANKMNIFNFRFVDSSQWDRHIELKCCCFDATVWCRSHSEMVHIFYIGRDIDNFSLITIGFFGIFFNSSRFCFYVECGFCLHSALNLYAFGKHHYAICLDRPLLDDVNYLWNTNYFLLLLYITHFCTDMKKIYRLGNMWGRS